MTKAISKKEKAYFTMYTSNGSMFHSFKNVEECDKAQYHRYRETYGEPFRAYVFHSFYFGKPITFSEMKIKMNCYQNKHENPQCTMYIHQ